ncbi:Magnesium transporter NIPA2 [Cladobotryum mycophilum]|uniref:Magnesium transporter NIPA2 n=1 Tax=Cladobotryum mycophilum TaxID=491253 RepID=A0ABR0S8Y9_9HYPO
MDHDLYARSGIVPGGAGSERPAYYKAVGIGLAVGSGVFIGTSFVLKKVGLLRANEKYNEVAGEGYGYLKNGYWWAGMTLMIIGEICNFVAYAFTDAILVTPLGALSVVLTTILSAIFLKERLSLVGKVACFLCIIGSVVIVMNAPQESSVADIQEMRHYVITPGFLTYAGVIIVGSIITAFFVGPKYGNKNMLVYISICSWVGGLSVVSTQGLGAAIIAWIGGKPQYKEWFLWVLFVFVIGTLLTEIIFLNKALNIFNAAIVTPTYYVYFTSTTIITSAVLFQGFKGTAQSIVTVVLGFLTICSGVVLLQLSKSAKDVPDAAVFNGDLDQIHTIAEQEQPETEPKADAIRGAAAIVRRISKSRMRMEAEELKRLHEEKLMMQQMEPISEDGQVMYEWDGLRRRRTVASSLRARSATSPTPVPTSPGVPRSMSRFPTDEELEEHDGASTIFSSIAGTIRRPRNTPNITIHSHDDYHTDKMRSPMHPVPLTEITVLHHKPDDEVDDYYGPTREHIFHQDPEYHRVDVSEIADAQSLAPTPPPHSTRRQYSFNRVFRRTPQPSEEERVGLVRTQDSDPGPPGPAPQAFI